jgi:hypothetical protein
VSMPASGITPCIGRKSGECQFTGEVTGPGLFAVTR